MILIFYFTLFLHIYANKYLFTDTNITSTGLFKMSDHVLKYEITKRIVKIFRFINILL
jgi:hypothetical protein